MFVRTEKEIYNQKLIIGLTTTLLILCYTFYFLRILSRKLLQTPLWIDDWFMLFALSLYVFMMFWALGVAVVKIGILLFYWRIFIVYRFRRLVAIVGCLILTSSLAIFLSFMLQCRSIPRFWAETSAGSCIDQVAFYISAGSINIASDVLVLSLPMRQVWKLNATVYERMALTFLFCLGGFVCITSILRLMALNDIDPDDFSYTNVGGGLWSTVEVQVGFICANLPHTRPLVIRWYQRWRPRGLVRSSTSDYPDSYITQTHRSHPSHRHDTLGFQSLDSDGKAVGQDTETLGGGEQAYTGGFGEGNLDPEVGGIRAPGERIKVRTEVRQEVQRMGSPGPLKLKKCWRNDTVSTEISAKA
ncbi:hypothetical protein G7Y79_00021g051180 [Physcia stellaris]|nr:hypothetical protein G7Y79_00021g051180 [Physcia stellaris]